MSNFRLIAILVAWLLAAALFTGLGGVKAWPPPFPQVLLASLVALLLLAYGFVASFRKAVDALPTHQVVALHLSRFVGAYFLVLYADGQLPYAFAVLGGWGDISVASLALILLVLSRGSLSPGSLPLQLWNLLGLVDILFVVSTAVHAALSQPESIASLTVLPLGLLPTFLVPLIIFSHVVIGRRGLLGWRKDSGGVS
jgi:hypothetical protein